MWKSHPPHTFTELPTPPYPPCLMSPFTLLYNCSEKDKRPLPIRLPFTMFHMGTYIHKAIMLTQRWTEERERASPIHMFHGDLSVGSKRPDRLTGPGANCSSYPMAQFKLTARSNWLNCLGLFVGLWRVLALNLKTKDRRSFLQWYASFKNHNACPPLNRNREKRRNTWRMEWFSFFYIEAVGPPFNGSLYTKTALSSWGGWLIPTYSLLYHWLHNGSKGRRWQHTCSFQLSAWWTGKRL